MPSTGSKIKSNRRDDVNQRTCDFFSFAWKGQISQSCVLPIWMALYEIPWKSMYYFRYFIIFNSIMQFIKMIDSTTYAEASPRIKMLKCHRRSFFGMKGKFPFKTCKPEKPLEKFPSELVPWMTSVHYITMNSSAATRCCSAVNRKVNFRSRDWCVLRTSLKSGTFHSWKYYLL
jgi:hypothetical protein